MTTLSTVCFMLHYQHPQYFLFHNHAVKPQQIDNIMHSSQRSCDLFISLVLLLYFHALHVLICFKTTHTVRKVFIKTNLSQLLILDNTNWNSRTMFYRCCKCFCWRVTKDKHIQISFYSFQLLDDFRLGVIGQLIKDHWNWELQRIAIMDFLFFFLKLLEIFISLYGFSWKKSVAFNQTQHYSCFQPKTQEEHLWLNMFWAIISWKQAKRWKNQNEKASRK